MSAKLTPDVRSTVVLAALGRGVNISELARRYGIRRQRVYQLLEDATIDPKGQLREAAGACVQEACEGAGGLRLPCVPM